MLATIVADNDAFKNARLFFSIDSGCQILPYLYLRRTKAMFEKAVCKKRYSFQYIVNK